MTFEIKSYDFDRDDGLVEVVVKLKRLHSLKPTKKTNDNLCVKKVKAPKIDIQILKNILKNPLTIDRVREFYRIYGYKMIQMDFGQFEMFNIKKVKYIQRQTYQRSKEGIRRWGQYFQLGTSTFEQIFDSLNFLTNIFREILYSQRVSLCCQNDNKRKYEYPFKSLMVFDPLDTLEFSLFQLSDLNKRTDKQYNELIKMKIEQFQNVTGNSIAGESLKIIIPFVYVQKNERQFSTYLVIAILTRQNKSQAFELKIEMTTKLRVDIEHRNLIYDFLQSVFNNIKKPTTPITFISKHVPRDQIQHFINILEQTAYGFPPNENNYQKYMEQIPNHIKNQKQQNQILDPEIVFPSQYFDQIKIGMLI